MQHSPYFSWRVCGSRHTSSWRLPKCNHLMSRNPTLGGLMCSSIFVLPMTFHTCDLSQATWIDQCCSHEFTGVGFLPIFGLQPQGFLTDVRLETETREPRLCNPHDRHHFSPKSAERHADTSGLVGDTRRHLRPLYPLTHMWASGVEPHESACIVFGSIVRSESWSAPTRQL